MRTTTGLLFIGAGAILAFAVTANTSALNLHSVGYVLIVIGLAGMLMPRRRRDWLGRRLIRRTQWWPSGQRVEETSVPPYVASNPGDQRLRAGLPPVPSVLGSPRNPGTTGRYGPGTTAPAGSELTEDVYDED
jgi:hypothetical protein